MIYLITGVPGSGKTLYAVAELVRKLIAEKINGKDGQPLKRRLCVDGVPALVTPHEVMASIVEDDKGVQSCDGDGLLNWWQWCRPGDVILVDEVQRYLRPRAMGSKPPQMVKELETHRHKGVDLVLITQSPMLLDQNVRRLVGRHINVRRIFGGARAILYDWDGCQSDVHRTAGASRSVWSYPRAAYKLYRSAELHTKQRQKIPVWFVFPLVVAAIAAVAGPKAYDTMTRSMSGKSLNENPSKPIKPVATSLAPVAAASSPAVAVAPVSASSSPGAVDEPDEPAIAGCVVSGPACRCYDKGARIMALDDAQCRQEARPVVGSVGSRVTVSGLFDSAGIGRLLSEPVPAVPFGGSGAAESDGEVLAFMAGRRP